MHDHLKSVPPKKNTLKARFVAQQVACGERDDVFASTPPLAVARALLALASSGNSKETGYNGLFDITAAFVHSPIDELIVLISPAGIVQPGQGLLLRRALYGRRKASNSGRKLTQRP